MKGGLTMSYKTIAKYHKNELGYLMGYTIDVNEYITQPYQLIKDNNGEWLTAPFINDDWFTYINTASVINRNVIDIENNTFVNVNNVTYKPTITDDYIFVNYGHRIIFEDIFYSIKDYDFAPVSYDTSINALILERSILREMIYNLFVNKRENYKRIFDVIHAEYNPLYNVDGTTIETHSGTDTTTHGGDDETKHTGTDTTTHGGSDTVADSGTDTTNSDVYPFDGNETDRDKTETTYGKETETTYNSESGFTHGENVKTTYGETVDTEHGEVITTRRYGNIGVTKSTELVADEIKLFGDVRTKFLTMVCDDIVKLFTY